MKKELLFFERENFYIYQEQKQNEGYAIISISDFLINLSNDDFFEQFDYKSQIIDISALAAGYNDVQPLGEQLIKKFMDFETIFIADKKHEETLKYGLRYSFLNFKNVEIVENNKEPDDTL
ncbi:hypothetical protein LDB17_08345 [Dysgonomonas sp. Shenzhen-Wh21]